MRSEARRTGPGGPQSDQLGFIPWHDAAVDAAAIDEQSEPTEVVIAEHPTQERVVEALRESWRALASFAADFDDEQWNTASRLPGWSVRDVYAHILGTEKMLAGEPAPDIDVGSPAHVHNEIGATNEAWVRSLATLEPADLLAEFISVTHDRIAALNAMSAEEWTAASWTPAGDSTLGRWMHIRVFDCWVHEQDVRVALGLPGGLHGAASALSLLEVVIALGFIVGKRGGAEDGSRIEFRLFGGDKLRLLRVAVDRGRASVVETFDGPATSTLTMPYELFMRLTSGRRSASDALADGVIQLDGDTRTAERIARNLGFTI